MGPIPLALGSLGRGHPSGCDPAWMRDRWRRHGGRIPDQQAAPKRRVRKPHHSGEARRTELWSLAGIGNLSARLLRCGSVLMPDSDEILTIREVAALLKIGEKTAYATAQGGELPSFKVRGRWRFARSHMNVRIRARVGRFVMGDDGPGGNG